MNKKTATQVLMIFFVIFICWIFFFKYFKKDENIVENITIKKENISEGDLANFIKNIDYTSSDLKGNDYQITARQAEIEVGNRDVMFLEDVIAYVYMKDSETIKITSDFGKYNSNNYDTIFSKNVIVTYLDHEITSDYLDFSLLDNLGTMSTNVIYTGKNNKLFADRLEMDISSKDTKIFMNDGEKKVIIKVAN
tara:strand:- start:1790 stop:2371 length:582 start_codon:yes stop_codon:yes gene_type:complete